MTLSLEVFVIRHAPTGNYLPAHGRGTPRRGFSFDEPMPNGGDLGPRIFISHKSAIGALTAWLMGHHVPKHSGGGAGLGSYPENDDYEEWTEIEKQPHRKRVEMEIVPCRLQEEPRE